MKPGLGQLLKFYLPQENMCKFDTQGTQYTLKCLYISMYKVVLRPEHICNFSVTIYINIFYYILLYLTTATGTSTLITR